MGGLNRGEARGSCWLCPQQIVPPPFQRFKESDGVGRLDSGAVAAVGLEVDGGAFVALGDGGGN